MSARARSLGAVAAALALTAAAAPASASADALSVHIPGTYFSPATTDAVIGDTVTWTNDSFTNHTVTADDGSFDSGTLAAGSRFSHTFTAAGQYRFYCTIHPFMTGEVDVAAIGLRGPAGAVVAGAPAQLTGRAAPGTPWVTIEQQLAGGAWTPDGSVQPAGDGSFAIRVAAVRGASYRAVAGSATSAPVTLRVLTGIRLRLTAAPGRRRTVLRVVATPAQPGARVVLQLYSLEHYAWQRRAVARLDRHSTARFVLPSHTRRLARVILPMSGARPTSRIVRTWRPHGHSGPPAKPLAAD